MLSALVLALGGLMVAVLVLFPLLLAAVELTMRRGHRHLAKSKLCVGRVWHTRFHPKHHAFTYPIFMFALDLEDSFGNFLWPMVRFLPQRHHLKNGEGNEGRNGSSTPLTEEAALARRVRNLVASKTQNKFQPTVETHRIILLTHLEYFGYNFNPVSFYYLVNKSTQQLDAMLGEVSNTPWTEMYCYVLHPDSEDRVECRQKQSDEAAQRAHHDFRFPKEFHVSPFMEMEYWYDWTFQGIPGQAEDEFMVINSLRRRSTEERLDFTAKLRMVAQQPITPFAVTWHMIRFPVFCMLIQIWIHYQAAWLFIKGVVYIPHPQGSETAASKTIATIMTPFFAIRDYLVPKSKTA